MLRERTDKQARALCRKESEKDPAKVFGLLVAVQHHPYSIQQAIEQHPLHQENHKKPLHRTGKTFLSILKSGPLPDGTEHNYTMTVKEESATNGGGAEGTGTNGESSPVPVVAEPADTSATPESATSATGDENGAASTALENGNSRFGGLGAVLEDQISFSQQNLQGGTVGDYLVTATQLGQLSNDRTRTALITILEQGMEKDEKPKQDDPEQPGSKSRMHAKMNLLIEKMKDNEKNGPFADNSREAMEADKNADVAANCLTSLLLRSSPEQGIDPREVELRREEFGTNAITDKKLDSFLKLCWEAVQDFVLIMLIVLGVISIVVEVTTHEKGECTTCWIEGAAILVSVGIVVTVTAGIDYAKQFAFIRLTRSLHETNTKQVIRDGKQVSVIDDDIVVGDILSVNSHNLASIPADCVLLGPASGLKMDESTLTGESNAISKRAGDVVLSGTTAIEGSGKMVVIAVGTYSVAGKIKARVYESEDADDELGGDEDSPLFVKLDLIAKQIGIAGTVAAAVAFIASCIIGLAIRDDDVSEIVEYLIVAITVLAVAVPEGLPLAVTLALAFSSNKMMKEQNLVKHLDACETMGCATTICTDKTGKYNK